jgi:predicted PurR-regulated permease PerM
MTASEWISLSLAVITLIGVGIALYFGIRSIRATRIIELVKYKNDLMEKVSSWLANIQNLYGEVYLGEFIYPFNQITLSSENIRLAIATALSKLQSEHGKVLEEGRTMFGLAVFISKDLSEATKPIETNLHNSFEVLLKYTNLIIKDTSNDEELLDVLDRFDKDYRNKLKEVDELVIQAIGKIFDARIKMLDSIIKGSDPLKDV